MASPAGDSLETALDELYGSDPADFVAIRKQIAARLREAGERDATKTILAARRPTVAAHVLNRLARAQPELITALLERSTELRDSFRVSRDDVRAATASHRDALRTVTDAALALLGDHSDSARSQIQSTLHTAGIDTEVARLLRTGRLEKEMTGPSGFGESELPDIPATGRHLRLAPALDNADATATDARLSLSDAEAAEHARERAAAEQAAHEAAERERQERKRIEAAAREQRWAEIQAALAAAEVEATHAIAEFEAARQVERDLETQLQGAQDRRARAEAQAREMRGTVAELRSTLDLEAAGDIPNEETTV